MIYCKTEMDVKPKRCYDCDFHGFSVSRYGQCMVLQEDLQNNNNILKDCPLFEEKRNYRDMYNKLLAKYGALRAKYEPEEFKKSVMETMKGIFEVLSEEEK